MSSVESILVCRLSALGDVVLALPAVEALREHFPEARLEFLSREPHGRVLRGTGGLDALHLWKGPGNPLPPEVAERRWDLVCDLSGSGRSRRLLLGVRGRRRLRVAKESWKRFAFVHLRLLGGGSVALSPALDRMFSCLAPLGISRNGRVPRFPVGPGPEDGPALLAPGAGRATKRWPAERFRDVANRLAAGGRPVLLLGSREERELLVSVGRDVAPGRREIVAGPSPEELPGIVARCRIALTNDSGILHVAEACGVPVVAIFGPTHPRLGFAPLRADSVVLHEGLPCSPCDLHGPARCPRGHHGCMTGITPDRVAEEMLDRVREEARA